MNGLRTPGVYLRYEEEKPPPGPRLASITGFVGLAERGPLNSPQRLEKWGDFETVFGRIIADADLGPAVYGFFSNGGKVCYVVRVADARRSGSPPTSAAYHLRNAEGETVVTVHAANEGAWGDLADAASEEELETGLRFHFFPSREPMLLTRLTRPATTASVVIGLETTVDLFATDVPSARGSSLTLVDPSNTLIRVDVEVEEVIDETDVRLGAPPSANLPEGSLALGLGLDLTVAYDVEGFSRNELFENLSMDRGHPRYFVDIVNGDLTERSYLAKSAAGNSILVRLERIDGLPPTWVRPLRSVDPYKTSVELAALPASVSFPTEPDTKISHDDVAEELSFIGTMSQAERDALLALDSSADPDYADAVGDLYEVSQASPPPIAGVDPALPIGYRFYTGYDGGAYFPHAEPAVNGYQGLASFETVEEIGLVAIPDLSRAEPETTFINGQLDMLFHCDKMGGRFAILDSLKQPSNLAAALDELVPEHIEKLTLAPEGINGALYFPWIEMRPGEGDAETSRLVPPCGFVAGIFARTETLEGVHRSPANEPLVDAIELQFVVDDAAQERLNPAGVNVIRAFPGRGIRIWGARTLSRDPMWRHIAVRRTMLVIKKEIEYALQWAVFEPNTRGLQQGVAASLNSYLGGLYRANVLAGTAPEEAFFVKCGETTNTTESMERGELIAEIGFAPLHPAEFIVATIKKTAESIDLAPVP